MELSIVLIVLVVSIMDELTKRVDLADAAGDATDLNVSAFSIMRCVFLIKNSYNKR